MARRHQLGESKVGCIIGAAVLLIAAFVAIKVVPVRMSVATLQDYIEEQAQRAGNLGDKPNNPVTQQLVDMFYRKAQEENLPVKKEAIKVGINNGRCQVEVRYTVEINLIVYTYVWNVEHKVERLLF